MYIAGVAQNHVSMGGGIHRRSGLSSTTTTISTLRLINNFPKLECLHLVN